MTSTELTNTISDIEFLEQEIRSSLGMPTSNLMMKTVLDISREIPSNTNIIAASFAEHLAGRFLKGMELCGDLAAMAFRYEHQAETMKKKEYSTAYLVRAPEQGYKRQKDQEFFAFQDQQYLDACEKLGTAKAFRIMITQKHNAFEKAHHMMRKLAEHHDEGLLDHTKLTQEKGRLTDFSFEEDIDWNEALKG